MNYRSNAALGYSRRTGPGGCRDRIETGQEPAAARLPRDGGTGSITVAPGAGRSLGAVAARTTIHITYFDATLLVDADIEKVEQVTANISPAAGPDASALDRCVRRSIGDVPGAPPLESM